MGLTDTMTLHEDEVLSATYYERLPENPRDNGVPFHYDIVDESDRAYAKLLDNLKTERTVLTIKTDDKVDVKIGGYISTQDGMFWQVSGVITRYVNEHTKQALRMLKETVQTAKIIRLLDCDNPWELR